MDWSSWTKDRISWWTKRTHRWSTQSNQFAQGILNDNFCSFFSLTDSRTSISYFIFCGIYSLNIEFINSKLKKKSMDNHVRLHHVWSKCVNLYWPVVMCLVHQKLVVWKVQDVNYVYVLIVPRNVLRNCWKNFVLPAMNSAN